MCYCILVATTATQPTCPWWRPTRPLKRGAKPANQQNEEISCLFMFMCQKFVFMYIRVLFSF